MSNRLLSPQTLLCLLALSAGCLHGPANQSTATASTPANVETAASEQPAAIQGELTAGPSKAEGNNIFWNSDFEDGTLQPWSVNFGSAGKASVVDGEGCLDIQRPGRNAFDVVFRQGPVPAASGHTYQLRFKAHANKPTTLRTRLAKVGPPYNEYWAAAVQIGPSAQTYTGTFELKTDDENAEFVIQMGGPLATSGPVTVCIDDIELNDPKFKVPEERAVKLSRVRVNQVGYLPQLAKTATVKSASKQPLEWQLLDSAGKTVASGKTKLFGEDRAAGEVVHQIDFTSFKTAGKGYRLKVGEDESPSFDIGADVYRKMKYDALAFFYLQRSGVEIKMPYAGSPEHVRPAGHVGDKSVPCAPAAKCDYSLDVSGGWYDAGDHGKYVVNGGISVWTLQNQYETLKLLGKTAGDFGDGKMSIPERKNGAPDLLDEARFEIDFLLKMQVPKGKPFEGMAHHKMHGESWSAIPTLPHEDSIKRFLRPVGTGATLNLAASAAQAARLWKEKDPAFSKRCLEAAETAWAAAKKNPKIIAEGMTPGGGAYGDPVFEDELYWAAAELFITTGKAEYKDEILKSRLHTQMTTTAGGSSASMNWDHVAGLGKISLAVVPNELGKDEIDKMRRQIVGAADKYLGFIQKRGYRMPLESELRYPWGSNSPVMNDAIVLGLAYFFTKDAKYANGAVDCMDYILGRNPKSQSYISGYGTRPMMHPHHRVWAHQKDPKLPNPPPGVMSGGPNSGIEDPYAKQAGLGGCPAQKCYVDHIESYSTNEVAINWNAPFAWAAAFLDEMGKTK